MTAVVPTDDGRYDDPLTEVAGLADDPNGGPDGPEATERAWDPDPERGADDPPDPPWSNLTLGLLGFLMVLCVGLAGVMFLHLGPFALPAGSYP